MLGYSLQIPIIVLDISFAPIVNMEVLYISAYILSNLKISRHEPMIIMTITTY